MASAEASTRFALPWQEVQARRSCHACGPGLGDLVHALTARLGIPHCPGCARRKRWLNCVTAWWVGRDQTALQRSREKKMAIHGGAV